MGRSLHTAFPVDFTYLLTILSSSCFLDSYLSRFFLLWLLLSHGIGVLKHRCPLALAMARAPGLAGGRPQPPACIYSNGLHKYRHCPCVQDATRPDGAAPASHPQLPPVKVPPPVTGSHSVHDTLQEDGAVISPATASLLNYAPVRPSTHLFLNDTSNLNCPALDPSSSLIPVPLSERHHHNLDAQASHLELTLNSSIFMLMKSYILLLIC